MKILLVNDDGINGEGLKILAKSLEKDYELTIVAPEIERSAQSQAITIFKPITVKELELEGIKSKAYSVSGTPADCVRLALDKLLDEPVDLVVSGINMGLNAGMDILYSGTVAAAIEANLFRIPAMALSAEWQNGKVNYELAVDYAKAILEKSKEEFIKNNLILNINTPYSENNAIKGIKVCKVGDVVYDYYNLESEDNGRRLLQLKGRKDVEYREGTDRYFLSKGYATVTPLHYDLTNFNLLEEVETWL